MKIRVGNYVISIHELDEKISLNIKSVIGGVVKISKICDFIGYKEPVIYEIKNNDTTADIDRIQKNQIIGDYIISIEQKKDGKLYIWSSKIDKKAKPFVSRKLIDGESLTIALNKEISSNKIK